MKKTKVIIPALGILLLSTAASVTGTVAWYAANSTVTANGMKIKATIDSNFLAISKTQSLADHLATVDLASGSGAVLPTNWVNNSGWNWVSAIGTDAETATKVGNYTNLEISENTTAHFGQAGGKNYFVFDSVFVGLLGESETAGDYKLVCDVKFTTKKSSELNKCLTVGLEVMDAEGETKVADEFDEKYVLGSAAAPAAAAEGDPDGVTKNGSVTLIPGASLKTDGTGTEIKVYAFFNGDDAACTSANAINLDDITIDLTFNLKSVNP